MINHFTWRYVVRMSIWYPVTGCYLVAVLVTLLIAAEVLRVNYGITIIGFDTIMILLLLMRQDLNMVCRLVNRHHAQLLKRVDQLTDTFTASRRSDQHTEGRDE